LTEGKLRGIIAESVRRALMENDDYDEDTEFLNYVGYGFDKYVHMSPKYKREFMRFAKKNIKIIEALFDGQDYSMGSSYYWFYNLVGEINPKLPTDWTLSDICDVIDRIRIGYKNDGNI
jgi:hypothetical protein